MKSPLVSVIIPNYCHSDYLDKRIMSVLNQTYSNYEVIILDDFSPDNGKSKAVIEKYRNNEHVKSIVYNDFNSGSTFKQWHKGFELSSGDLIWVAESDDYCENNMLELLVSAFQVEDDVSLAFCNSFVVDNKGVEVNKDIACSIPEKCFDGCEFIKKHMILGNSIWNASAVLFSKKVALSVDNIYMNYKAAGDHLFWILLSEKGKVYHINRRLNYFRQHHNKVTPAKYAEGITIRELYNTVNYLRNKNYINPIDNLAIANYYINETNKYDYIKPEIRDELLKLWNGNGLYNKYTLKIVRVILKLFGRLR